MVELREHQRQVLDQIRPGTILRGGVGSGKSITALAYYYTKEVGGSISPWITPPTKPIDLYIITTAKKRDSLDWQHTSTHFGLSTDQAVSIGGIKVVVDSWNNLDKYVDVTNAFFIFDEQRLVGSGAWVKAFLKIARNQNKWIVLTATPGDNWRDYAPIFIANGFYKNITEFTLKHIVYKRFAKYPKIDHYVNTEELITHRKAVIVEMAYRHDIKMHRFVKQATYDEVLMERVVKKRWNPFTDKPIRNPGELAFVQRRIVNSDPSRLAILKEIHEIHHKVIVFYNFDYELYLLRDYLEANKIHYTEWNGHKHQDVPTCDNWVYLVQYTAGAEAWECITTNAMYLYSQNYSYKVKVQTEGRIDRLNTPFEELYYYYGSSNSRIDRAIGTALATKKNFNERDYEEDLGLKFAA